MSVEVEVQCRSNDADGARCARLTKKTDKCAQHLELEDGHEMQESVIEDAVLGLFTIRERVRGDNICQYGGRVVIDLPDSDDELEAEPFFGPYVLQIKKKPPTFIDAARTDSIGRYCNSARDSGWKNNAQFVIDRRKKVAWIRATKKITPVSEIFVAYGRGYW